ncbi:MAG: branched-chain amino acid aminotransferase [Deltaproteobacteria bacterium]
MVKTSMRITKKPLSSLTKDILENPGFGIHFSDHMFSAEYEAGQWQRPEIMPFGDMSISPAMCTLHYGQAVFEGLKAFHAEDGTINLFRIDKYHSRFQRSSRRLCIPEVSYDLFRDGLTELVKLDREWVPRRKGYALYIRPFIFATDNYLGVRVSETYRFLIITSPVGAYYKEGMNPVRLVTSGEYVRAARGGLGEAKTPANYAASILPAEEAKKRGFTQVLWLDAVERRYVEEVGTMNIFFVIGDELVTPSLDGSVLAGVTRDSVIQLARHWGMKVVERRISIDELIAASSAGTLKEAFGTGTAATISPVGEICHNDKKIVINGFKTGEFAKKAYDYLAGVSSGTGPDEFGWRYVIRP